MLLKHSCDFSSSFSRFGSVLTAFSERYIIRVKKGCGTQRTPFELLHSMPNISQENPCSPKVFSHKIRWISRPRNYARQIEGSAFQNEAAGLVFENSASFEAKKALIRLIKAFLASKKAGFSKTKSAVLILESIEWSSSNGVRRVTPPSFTLIMQCLEK